MGAAGTGSSIPNSSSFLSKAPDIALPPRQISRNPGGPWLIGARLASGRGLSHADNYGDGPPIRAMVKNATLRRFGARYGGRSVNASVAARLCADPGCAAILRI